MPNSRQPSVNGDETTGLISQIGHFRSKEERTSLKRRTGLMMAAGAALATILTIVLLAAATFTPGQSHEENMKDFKMRLNLYSMFGALIGAIITTFITKAKLDFPLKDLPNSSFLWAKFIGVNSAGGIGGVAAGITAAVVAENNLTLSDAANFSVLALGLGIIYSWLYRVYPEAVDAFEVRAMHDADYQPAPASTPSA